jgi:hypothetical protein
VADIFCTTAGISIRIVLNFGILKILLPTPTRSDQYSAGPLEISLTKTAMIKIGTDKTIIKQRENSKLNIFLRVRNFRIGSS